MRHSPLVFGARPLVAAAVLGAALGTAVASDLLAGPAAIDLDEARCALCRMRIANRRYLAQLQTKDGEIHAFDDPGCLIRTLIESRPRVHARYFMGPGGRWIPGRDVAFVEASGTPMGYGLAAVRRGAPHAIAWDEAWRRVQRRVASARQRYATPTPTPR